MAEKSCLLPVAILPPKTEEDVIKPERKIQKGVFAFFFAVYLVSTLLGAALVPGKMELDGISFALSIIGNGASFLCVERCFFAFFLLFAGFTVFRILFSLLFSVGIGIYTGICVRLLLYSMSALSSAALSLIFAFQILFDVFISVVCFYVLPYRNKSPSLKRVSLYVSCFIVYFLVTYSLSLLISLMLKYL